MRRFLIGAAIAALVLPLLPAPRAEAWGDVGHLTVAKLAWDQLNKGQRLAAYQTLLKLPHLQKFLETHPKPKQVGDQEWLFLIAADWPDWLKDFKKAAKMGDAEAIDILKEHVEDWHFLDITAERSTPATTVSWRRLGATWKLHRDIWNSMRAKK